MVSLPPVGRSSEGETEMKRHYETATWGDGVLSVALPFWGVVVGLMAIVFRKERRRGLVMVCIGVVVLCLWGIQIYASNVAHAQSHHYKAPKLSTYHAPKVYTPHYNASTHVRGYVKADGTYVAPHMRTAPNATMFDNWSSRPNVNPYTGKPGTKDPYAPPSSGGG